MTASVPPEPADDRPDDPGVDEAVLVAVGRIGKAHGLRGEVSVEAWTDDPHDRFAPGAVLTAEPGPVARAGPTAAGAGRVPMTVESSRVHAGRWLISFTGVADRTAAEALRGTRLLLPARARPPIEDPDEFYDTDLIGLRVEGLAGERLGVVTDVVHGPVGDYLAVVLDAAEPPPGREHLIPFVADMVPRVEPDLGRVVIDPPVGLFDL